MKIGAPRHVACIAAAALCVPSTPALAASPRTIVVTGDECLVTSVTPIAEQQGLLGAIAAIFVPILAELFIDSVVSDLKKVRKQESSGSIDFNLWRRPAEGNGLALAMPACMTSITGEFSVAESKNLTEVDTTVEVVPGASMGKVIERLAANGITATKIYHVFESQVGWSPDHTAFNLKPVYARTFELLPGNRASKQGLVFNVSLRGPGASPWGTTYAMAPISMGMVSPGSELHLRSTNAETQKKLEGMVTGFMTIPGISEAAYRSYMQDFSRREIDGFMPANLKVDVTQTQKPSDAALFLATLLEKAKPKLVERAASAVDPDGPFKESQAKLDAEIAWRKAAKALADAQATGTTDAAALEILVLEEKKAREKYENLE